MPNGRIKWHTWFKNEAYTKHRHNCNKLVQVVSKAYRHAHRGDVLLWFLGLQPCWPWLQATKLEGQHHYSWENDMTVWEMSVTLSMDMVVTGLRSNQYKGLNRDEVNSTVLPSCMSQEPSTDPMSSESTVKPLYKLLASKNCENQFNIGGSLIIHVVSNTASQFQSDMCQTLLEFKDCLLFKTMFSSHTSGVHRHDWIWC